MPPSPRPIPRFIAEPPQEQTPYGRWAEQLSELFYEAARRIETDEDLGEPEPIVWFPDRTYERRTYVPATARTSTGLELFGYVSFHREHGGAAAEDFRAFADFTDETADTNPDWALDLSDQQIADWRGHSGRVGVIALVWGVAIRDGGAMATAQLGDLETDQCALDDRRFTLISLDDYDGDLLEVRLWRDDGAELACESLYADETEDVTES